MVFYEETGADLEWESERRGTRRLSSILGIFLSGLVCVYLELYCGEVISLGFHGCFFLVSFGHFILWIHFQGRSWSAVSDTFDFMVRLLFS